jgi:hypothetical protein
MKYLKSFNESLNDYEHYEFRDDITNFAEERLVSLLDEGFRLKIYDAVSKNVAIGFTIWLCKSDYNDSSFKWDDIKDDYIPFLQLISNKYKLLKFSTDVVRFNLGSKYNVNMKDLSLQDVIDDNVFQNYVGGSPDIFSIGVCITPNDYI